MKFFIQFVFYAAFFCVFVFIITVYFFVDLRRRTNDSGGAWIPLLAM